MWTFLSLAETLLNLTWYIKWIWACGSAGFNNCITCVTWFMILVSHQTWLNSFIVFSFGIDEYNALDNLLGGSVCFDFHSWTETIYQNRHLVNGIWPILRSSCVKLHLVRDYFTVSLHSTNDRQPHIHVTIACGEVRCMYLGNISLFHTGMSLLIDTKQQGS